MDMEQSSMNWNSRFKIASAAKRRGQDTEYRLQPVERHQIQDAKSVDPRALFEKYGLQVKPVGKQYSIRKGGDELYRSTFKSGHWVHCDHYGNGIGDNIAMVQELNPGLKFVDAVYELYGGPAFNPQSVPDLSHLRPKMPPCNDLAETK
jgi:hypothetical protein